MFSKILSFILSIVALFSGFTVGNEKDVIQYTNMPYGIRAKRQILDLYIPKSVKGNANMILYVHGGAWTEGSKDGFAGTLDDLSRQGYVCASLNYRYCGKPNYASVEDVLDDITSALKKIQETAAGHGVNIQGVMLDGGSAGAHLSLMYAYTRMQEAPIKPVAVVARSPITDFTDLTIFDGSLRNLDPEKWTITPAKWLDYLTCMTGKKFNGSNFEKRLDDLAKISPIRYVNENTVPTIIAHGTMDSVLPYTGSVALDAKLTEYGVPHTFITYEGAWHDLLGCPEADQEMGKAYAQFLQNYIAQ